MTPANRKPVIHMSRGFPTLPTFIVLFWLALRKRKPAFAISLPKALPSSSSARDGSTMGNERARAPVVLYKHPTAQQSDRKR
ncbi:hypothetical protein TNCT_508231 [Trichonephila clavata]|uniref:Uncharacterized protein n=1 Tax=Trichonephila clavata TaxID=2740835 RepID=A0A8X6IXC7_TRICU|nr:hypothetical protein TNCT_508231 [Trichonephila clavata]